MNDLGAISQAWLNVEAALPLDWHFAGVLHVSAYELLARERPMPSMIADYPSGWVAIAQAHGPSGEFQAAGGFTSVQALNHLADVMKERRGAAAGE